VHITYAQEKTISGTVSDETGPLPGVSIIKKGTSQGTETDFDGKYTLKAKTGDILVFSFVGMKTEEKTIGTSNSINVTMSASENVLDEVVLTAFGSEKKKDQDISSSTSVSTDVLKRSGESGLVQGLSGKTSGVNITKNSGDPGAGAYIQIRGQNTILGDNQPLIVLDGVIISNQSIGVGSTDGVSQQSRLNDIPSEDIENVTVIKGAAAAAVYGTGAANGAIIIKTKSGSGNSKKWSVNLKTAVSIDEINIEWDKQSTYGQGTGGLYLGNTISGQGFFNGLSWGDKISDRSGGTDLVTIGNERFVSDNGNTIYPYAIDPATGNIGKNSREIFNQSNRDQIFGTGVALDNSISLSHNTEKSKTYISLSNWDQQGIIREGSAYERTTFRINQETKFTDKLTGKIGASYVDINSDRVQQGSNLNGLYLGYLRTPADFDQTDYSGTYFDADGFSSQGSHRAFRNYLGSSNPAYNNPLWTINEQINTSNVNRFIINPEVTYKFNDAITFTGRYGVDFYTDDRTTFFPTNSGGGFGSGYYEFERYTNKIQTFNMFANGNHDVSEDFTLSWIAGFQSENSDYEALGGVVTSFTNQFFTLDDATTVDNSGAANQDPSSFFSYEKKNGGYAVLNATLFDQVYLEATGRLEKISTIPNRTIFYPSASLGWQFTEALEANNTLSFGKLRLSYGEVGVAPTPYQTLSVFNTIDGGENYSVASSWGDSLDGSIFGSTFKRTDELGNPDIKEERVKEFEIGTDLRFLSNRISLGFTYYSRVTEDALLPVTLPASTGYVQTVDNVAEIENSGLELDLSATIVRNENITWKVGANFSTNKNIVTKLEGADSVFLNGFTGTSSNVIEGEAFGVLFGGQWLRDDNGNILLDENGFPDEDISAGVIGDPNPEWRGGVNTSFTYKGFTISALVETSQGNEVWNGTGGVLDFFGVSTNTDNEVTVSAAQAAATNDFFGNSIDQIANMNSDGTYTVRGSIENYGDGDVLLNEDWYTNRGGGFGNVAEQYIEDASWVKLREISLSYALPSKYLNDSLINSIDFGITGRNLYTWTGVEGFDPEANLTGASRGRGLEYFTNPSTRSFIMSLKIGF